MRLACCSPILPSACLVWSDVFCSPCCVGVQRLRRGKARDAVGLPGRWIGPAVVAGDVVVERALRRVLVDVVQERVRHPRRDVGAGLRRRGLDTGWAVSARRACDMASFTFPAAASVAACLRLLRLRHAQRAARHARRHRRALPGDGIPGCGCIGGTPGDSGIGAGPGCCGGGAPCGGAPGGGICGICICGICGAIDCGGGCEMFISVCAIRSRWPDAPCGGLGVGVRTASALPPGVRRLVVASARPGISGALSRRRHWRGTPCGGAALSCSLRHTASRVRAAAGRGGGACGGGAAIGHQCSAMASRSGRRRYAFFLAHAAASVIGTTLILRLRLALYLLASQSSTRQRADHAVTIAAAEALDVVQREPDRGHDPQHDLVVGHRGLDHHLAAALSRTGSRT